MRARSLVTPQAPSSLLKATACFFAFPFFWLCALACLLTHPVETHAADTPARTAFDLPAGDASATLRHLSRQAPESVLFPPDLVRGVATQAVRGSFTTREAAERMVAGTALQVLQDDPTGALTIARRSPPTSVSTGLPSTPSLPPSPLPMKRKSLLSSLGGWLALAVAPFAGAASGSDAGADRGTIAGRIFNPATGEYVRHAEVRVVGGPSVSSGDEGLYLLSGVAAGEATVVVSFTGLRTETATVRVAPGATVTHDFDLVSAQQAVASDGTVKLEAFVVSSQREGNARAIMEQRNSMNITNSLSSDVFGTVAEGNVGEFLKHLPGVDFDSLDGTVRYVSLRGMGTEYAGVQVDGMSFASANAEGSSRGFSFEQVSLSAMESIEISKTISADVDASSPAGTVNLKTKRAFDRAGRRVSASASLTGHSEQLSLGRSPGPGDDDKRKLFPSVQFEYSDVFLNRRLGIVLGLSESNSYIQRAPTTMTYNYTPTAASPEPMVLASIRAQQIHQTIERFAGSLTADFKATPRLILSLSVMYNHSDVWSGQRSVTFNTGARTSPVSGPDPLNEFTTTAANGSVTVEPQGVAKVGNGKSYTPRFEYKLGDLTIEGRFGRSDSFSAYNPMKYRDSVFSSGVQTLPNVRFGARRSEAKDGDWKIAQTGGGDWNDGALFSAPAIILNDGRSSSDKIGTEELIATLRTLRFLPVTWKAGAKWKHEERDYANRRAGSYYNYIGPGAGVGAWRNLRSPLTLDFSAQDLYIASSSGGGVFLPDIMGIARTFRTSPESFAPTMSATDYYNANVANEKKYSEDIDALYLMATTRVGPVNLRAGLRREETRTDSLEFDALSSSEVAAAGYAVSGGRATTIPGIQYQYTSRPKIHRTGSYAKLFPSASLKYNVTRNFDVQAGYSKTIKRPSVDSVAGVWLINDDTLFITAPNVNLKPEISDNYTVRLARYFEPIGVAAVSFYENRIQGLHQTNMRIGSSEFPSAAQDYEGYTFITTGQSESDVRVRGLEFEYSQSLSFLPQPFKGLGMRASYTRTYAQVLVANMTPHLVTAGLTYAFFPVNLYANLNWGDSRPINAGGTQYQRHRLNLDLGGGYRISSRFSAFFSVRNVLDEPFIRMEKVGSNRAAAQFFQKFGVTSTIGVRATY